MKRFALKVRSLNDYTEAIKELIELGYEIDDKWNEAVLANGFVSFGKESYLLFDGVNIALHNHNGGFRIISNIKEINSVFDFKTNINCFTEYCYNQSKNAGWHDKDREVGTMLMLIVSEVAEAMEGDRKGLMDDHLPHRKMIEVELADAMIRIADLAGKLGLDLGGAIDEKLSYNLNRPDHKKENRLKEGGKNY